MIDKYYESERFQNIRRTYENMKDGNTGCHLDSEELIDIAEYYYNLGLQDEAFNTANLALEIYPYSTAPLSLIKLKATGANTFMSISFCFVA